MVIILGDRESDGRTRQLNDTSGGGRAVELIEGGTIEEYGPAARGFVEPYNWVGVVDGFERVLEELMWKSCKSQTSSNLIEEIKN